jgi:DNA ligase D-like protein (predicted 3'-phosphoesterase)
MAKSKLALYQQKRDFTKTAEPSGRAKIAPAEYPRFVIQKHAARRLHYDLRLEVDGVFKSWAVTKGPSLDPADKRLAVETEDHPLDYGDFEGTVPKGEYGGGTVMLWDRGFWTADGDSAKALRKGELRFTVVGEKLQGNWVLVRLRHDRDYGKRRNWLLIKRHDGYERESAGDAVLSKRPVGGLGTHDGRDRCRQGPQPQAVHACEAEQLQGECGLALKPRKDLRSESNSCAFPEGNTPTPRAQERGRHARLHPAAALQEREPPAIGAGLGS